MCLTEEVRIWATGLQLVSPHLIPRQGGSTHDEAVAIHDYAASCSCIAIMTDTGITGLNILPMHMLYVTLHAQLRASRHITCLCLPQWKKEYNTTLSHRQGGRLQPLPGCKCRAFWCRCMILLSSTCSSGLLSDHSNFLSSCLFFLWSFQTAFNH